MLRSTCKGCALTLALLCLQVWISLTAFLHYIGQQESYEGKTEQLGRSEHVPVAIPIAERPASSPSCSFHTCALPRRFNLPDTGLGQREEELPTVLHRVRSNRKDGIYYA